MLNIDRRLQQMSRKTQFFWAAAIPAAVLAGSLILANGAPRDSDAQASEAVAQNTLPLPVPGSAPAPAAPETRPAAPTTAPTGPSEEAKARAAALAAKANVDVAEAWTRATPGNATTAAVYMRVVSAKDPDKLLGAETGAAEHVEVHDEMNQNGVVKMTAMPAVDIPGGATVNFAPNGKHFMLTGLKAPLKEGDSFLMTLKFDKGGTQNTVVKVLGATATGLPAPAVVRKGDTTAGVTQR